MTGSCVVVVNGVRARFFTLEESDFPEMNPGPNLVEKEDMVNPEGKSVEGGQWSETKSGRNRSAVSGGAHGYDDHRGSHEEEYAKRFARIIVDETLRRCQKEKAHKVLMVAQSHMLGLLRQEAASFAKAGIEMTEYIKDLAKANVQDLHAALAKEKLLPPRRIPDR